MFFVGLRKLEEEDAPIPIVVRHFNVRDLDSHWSSPQARFVLGVYWTLVFVFVEILVDLLRDIHFGNVNRSLFQMKRNSGLLNGLVLLAGVWTCLTVFIALSSRFRPPSLTQETITIITPRSSSSYEWSPRYLQSPDTSKCTALGFPVVVDALKDYIDRKSCDPTTVWETWSMPMSGVGSNLHVASWALGCALLRGHLLSIEGRWFYCQQGRSRPAFECYFEPFHKCPPYTSQVARAPFHACDRVKFPQIRDLVRLGVLPQSTTMRSNVSLHVGWWRAQSMGLFLRPNAEFLGLIRREMQPYLPLPHPFVSIHVRHGDKGNEMRLHPFAEYLNATRVLLKHPRGASIFVSTEDGGVIDEAAENKEWRFFWTTGHKRLNSGPLQASGVHGTAEEMRIAFLNLYICLEADAFVWTRGSNWGRLLDELRNISGRCDALNVDIDYDEW